MDTSIRTNTLKINFEFEKEQVLYGTFKLYNFLGEIKDNVLFPINSDYNRFGGSQRISTNNRDSLTSFFFKERNKERLESKATDYVFCYFDTIKSKLVVVKSYTIGPETSDEDFLDMLNEGQNETFRANFFDQNLLEANILYQDQMAHGSSATEKHGLSYFAFYKSILEKLSTYEGSYLGTSQLVKQALSEAAKSREDELKVAFTFLNEMRVHGVTEVMFHDLKNFWLFGEDSFPQDMAENPENYYALFPVSRRLYKMTKNQYIERDTIKLDFN